MATNPVQLEADLVAALQAAFPEIPVKAWPDDIERHQLRGPAEILVGYRGGPWRPPQPGTATQEREVELEIGLACKSMSGHQGATALLQAISKTVLGLRLPQARPMRVLEDRYLGRSPGIWWYALKVAVPGVMVLPAPLTEPRLASIRVDSGLDTSEITR